MNKFCSIIILISNCNCFKFWIYENYVQIQNVDGELVADNAHGRMMIFWKIWRVIFYTTSKNKICGAHVRNRHEYINFDVIAIYRSLWHQELWYRMIQQKWSVEFQIYDLVNWADCIILWWVNLNVHAERFHCLGFLGFRIARQHEQTHDIFLTTHADTAWQKTDTAKLQGQTSVNHKASKITHWLQRNFTKTAYSDETKLLNIGVGNSCTWSKSTTCFRNQNNFDILGVRDNRH